VRMRRLRARALGGFVLALWTSAWLTSPAQAGPTSSARPSSVALLGGVNIVGLSYHSPPAEADRAIAAAHQLRVKIVRTELPWSALEPRGPGMLDPNALAFTDRLLSDAAAAGIRVVATLAGTPCWVSSAPSSLLQSCRPGRDSKANGWPPTSTSDYATFVAYMAARYGSRLAAIEIWNEPDQSNEAYFAGPRKAQRYAALLRAAYPAIKQASPGMPVLAGSLVGSNGVFLRALYAAGIKGYYDGLSVHYYNLTLASLRSIHEVQLAYGDSKPLWLAEFGWSSCWPKQRIQQQQACVTGRIQAANLTDTLRALDRVPYVAAAIVYKIQDSARENFGMLSVGGTHKAAFGALARVLSSPFGGAGRTTVSLRRIASRVLASGSAPVGDFMELEAFQGSVLRYRAVFTLDRFNHFAIVLPAALGTHGLRVRVYQYSAGPSGGTQKSI
jgi:polysaccharide biosynthesis protein PslG